MKKSRKSPYIFCLICFALQLSCEEKSASSARTERKVDKLSRHVDAKSDLVGHGQKSHDDSPDQEAASAARLVRLKQAIHSFTEESNLAARDYDQYNKWLIELAEKFPAEACQLLASGTIDQAYGSKVSMFSAMLANPDQLKTIPHLEELAKTRNANPDGRETATAMSEALGKISSDPAYLGVIKSLFAGEDGGSNISYFFKEAGKLRGAELADHLDEFGLSGRDKDGAIMSIALSIAPQDQNAALGLLERLDAGFAGTAYGEIMLQMLDKDPALGKEMFLGLDDVKLQKAIRHPYLLQALTKSENVDLLQNALQRFVLTKESSSTFETLVRGMSALDKSEAVRILDQLPESSTRSGLIQDLWKRANLKSLDEAAQAISGLPKDSILDGTRGVVMSLASSNQDAALELIARTQPQFQSRLIADVIDQSVSASPSNAASTFMQETKSGRLNPKDALPLANRISLATANHNVRQAITWAENLPSDYQPGAYKGLMESWGKSDPVGASKWLAGVAEGPSRDAGARALVREIESTDSAMAAKWKATFEK
jgi:hypothetical protein